MMSFSKSEKTSTAVSVRSISSSSSLAAPSPSASCAQDVDLEKANGKLALDEAEAALARYVVPVLEKGVKTALKEPTSPWVRFRVWYNPYRMLFTLSFTLNMVGILLAGLHRFPYAEKHGAAIALGNIMAAVACRNELFLRYLFWIVVKLFQQVRHLISRT
ncbi:hypothetical protein NM688_g8500 [Phlebia brevispora]|uniref:Uncharacterized protein n=1 Tax=Phlebia brevispora TaxID=194682 RepID=A0ACC1RTZ6_9APHY|nr:hypothetical protein NM688_g8500 [Phlebia brevispora]